MPLIDEYIISKLLNKIIAIIKIKTTSTFLINTLSIIVFIGFFALFLSLLGHASNLIDSDKNHNTTKINDNIQDQVSSKENVNINSLSDQTNSSTHQNQAIKASSNQTSTKLVLYTSRNTDLIQPVTDLFEKLHSKIKVDIYTSSAGLLIEKLKSQADKPQADLLITVDAGNLWAAQQANLLAPISSAIIDKNVPAHYRDPSGYWFGVSIRARTIMYNSKLIKPSQLSTYEQLAESTWKKKLCLRTSKKVYNQSLVTMLIEKHGKAHTLEIIKGWVNNLGAPVFSSDTKLIEALASGQCQIAIANTYYLARIIKNRINKHSSDYPVKIFWPNQHSSGVHVNISGIGLIKNSKNKENAVQFIEFLYSTEAQQLFSSLNLEYPVVEKVTNHPIVESWGKFKASKMPLGLAGKHQKNAIILMDQAKYR